LGALTGCATYVEERPAPAYVEPAPAPVVVEATAAPGVVVIQAESDFYQPLTPMGRWVDAAGYGRVWIPGGVAVDWRPYSNGHWERTEAGWFWASDEPWAWATYHYGRWDYTPDYGWYWIPQTQWAPAWVAWRSGGDYVGWAPLPPPVRYERGIRIEGEVQIEPRSYVFVEQRRFMEPHRTGTVIVNNTTILNKTVINKTTIDNRTVINQGPSAAAIEKATGRPVRTVTVKDLRHTEEAPVAARRPAAPAAVQPGEKKAVLPRQAPPPEKPAMTQKEPAAKKPRNPEKAATPPAASQPGEKKAVPPRQPAPAEAKPVQKPAEAVQHQPQPAKPAAPKPAPPVTAQPKQPVAFPARPASPPPTAQRPTAPKPAEARPAPPAAKPGAPEKPEAKPATKEEKKKPDEP